MVPGNFLCSPGRFCWEDWESSESWWMYILCLLETPTIDLWWPWHTKFWAVMNANFPYGTSGKDQQAMWMALKFTTGGRIYEKKRHFDHHREKIPFLSQKLEKNLLGFTKNSLSLPFLPGVVFFNELIFMISCQTLHLLMSHVKKTSLLLPF